MRTQCLWENSPSPKPHSDLEVLLWRGLCEKCEWVGSYEREWVWYQANDVFELYHLKTQKRAMWKRLFCSIMSLSGSSHDSLMFTWEHFIKTPAEHCESDVLLWVCSHFDTSSDRGSTINVTKSHLAAASLCSISFFSMVMKQVVWLSGINIVIDMQTTENNTYHPCLAIIRASWTYWMSGFYLFFVVVCQDYSTELRY